MGNLNHIDSLPVLRSRLSFQPLIRAWKEQIQNENGGSIKIYSSLLQEVSQHSELLEPIDDFQLLEKHKELIEQLATTIFPVSVTSREKLYAITDPSCYKMVFASDLIKQMLPVKKENYVRGINDQLKQNISITKISMAYKLILEKFYKINLARNVTSIYSAPDAEKGLNNYLELEIDPFFIDVTCSGKLPVLPENYMDRCFTTNDLLNYPQLLEKLPLDQFLFDGIALLYIHDVTEKEAIRSIKEILKNADLFSDRKQIERLQQEIRYLLNMQGIEIGITMFFDMNKQFDAENAGDSNSILFKYLNNTNNKAELCKQLTRAFQNNSSGHLFFDKLKKDRSSKDDFLKHIISKEWTSAFIFPLHGDSDIIGSFEIFSKDANAVNRSLIPRIEPVVELLESVLRKKAEHLENEVNKIIKEQFTAVHPSVEWKFADAAIHYFLKMQNGGEPKIEPIVFTDVHALYGAIDIQNSSGQRNLSIQLDLAYQLSWVKRILVSAQTYGWSSLLREPESNIDARLLSIGNGVSASEEQEMLGFLNGEIAELLRHLQQTQPALAVEIEKYFQSIDPSLHMLNNHRKKFEESVSRINNNLSRCFEREQREAQKIYPHYFEHFVTDGVDFNIYIGQAIAPDKKFSDIYFKNIKLWQITTMVIAARRVYRLQHDLPVPLQTTQLILVFSNPIAIRFRSAERKFDVDGGYNVRYEVIKKRIDKVRIKNTNERLTKPGTIAIAYTQDNEAEQYTEYIDYLKKQNLITGAIEHFDLEELQGISGLKGLRIKIAFDETIDIAEESLHKNTELIPKPA